MINFFSILLVNADTTIESKNEKANENANEIYSAK